MNIPVDEMLTELRAVLEEFDSNPSYENFDKIQKEHARIERACEDCITITSWLNPAPSIAHNASVHVGCDARLLSIPQDSLGQYAQRFYLRPLDGDHGIADPRTQPYPLSLTTGD